MIRKIRIFQFHVREIGLFTSLIYYIQRIILKRNKLIKISLRGLRHPFFLRNKTYDTHIFYQIFIKNELKLTVPLNPKLIIDCGGNIGLATLYFLRNYPNCKILTIEPERENFELLTKNTEKYKNVRMIRSAVFGQKEQINIMDTGEGNASFITTNQTPKGTIIDTISTKTLDELILDSGCGFADIIKMDIEGSEFEVFSGNYSNWIDKFELLIVEIHELIKPGARKLINDVLSENFEHSRSGEYEVYLRNNLRRQC